MSKKKFLSEGSFAKESSMSGEKEPQNANDPFTEKAQPKTTPEVKTAKEIESALHPKPKYPAVIDSSKEDAEQYAKLADEKWVREAKVEEFEQENQKLKTEITDTQDEWKITQDERDRFQKYTEELEGRIAEFDRYIEEIYLEKSEGNDRVTRVLLRRKWKEIFDEGQKLGESEIEKLRNRIAEANKILNEIEYFVKDDSRKPMQEVGVYDVMEQVGYRDVVSSPKILEELKRLGVVLRGGVAENGKEKTPK